MNDPKKLKKGDKVRITVEAWHLPLREGEICDVSPEGNYWVRMENGAIMPYRRNEVTEAR